MPFAIKFTNGENQVRYYSQTIEMLHEDDGIKELILLTDGEDPDEVDVSRTLVEAEKKFGRLTIRTRYPKSLRVKIVEFPEPEEDDD